MIVLSSLKRQIFECRNISYALQVYERAFRQKIDIDQSECLVDKNVRSQLADETCELLGVRKSDSLDIYLGIPAHNCMNKSLVFNMVKDKVW